MGPSRIATHTHSIFSSFSFCHLNTNVRVYMFKYVYICIYTLNYIGACLCIYIVHVHVHIYLVVCTLVFYFKIRPFRVYLYLCGFFIWFIMPPRHFAIFVSVVGVFQHPKTIFFQECIYYHLFIYVHILCICTLMNRNMRHPYHIFNVQYRICGKLAIIIIHKYIKIN